MKFYYCLVLAITFLNLVKSEIDFIRSCTEPKTIALTVCFSKFHMYIYINLI